MYVCMYIQAMGSIGSFYEATSCCSHYVLLFMPADMICIISSSYIHTYMHTYIHTCRSYIRILTYIQIIHIHFNIHTHIHTYIITLTKDGMLYIRMHFLSVSQDIKCACNVTMTVTVTVNMTMTVTVTVAMYSGECLLCT